jgi:hypothetical protein
MSNYTCSRVIAVYVGILLIILDTHSHVHLVQSKHLLTRLMDPKVLILYVLKVR